MANGALRGVTRRNMLTRKSRAQHVPWVKNVALKYEGDECLLWPFCMRGGRRPQDAYPALGMGGYAHVLLCTLAHGPRPTPQHETEHLCGKHRCMNKKHVQWALHKENCARRTEHGTQTIGEKHGMAKLTEAEVLEIRKIPKRTRGVAEKYGISIATICTIRARKNWKHL